MKPVMQHTYDDLPEAHRLINAGDPTGAARILQCIIYTMGDETPAEVYEQLGIARRLRADGGDGDGFYELADEVFVLAERKAAAAGDRLRLGQILRNRAMVAICRRDLFTARIHLNRSLNSLRPTRKLRLPRIARVALVLLSPFSVKCHARLTEDNLAWWQADPCHLEYFVSKGFLGRVYYFHGQLSDDFIDYLRYRHRARKLFRYSSRELHGFQPYELNNRVWQFKVEWWWHRLFWARRTLRLARESGNRNRLKQVALLIISPRLADYAENVWKARKAK